MHFGFLALDYPSLNSGGGVGSQIRVLARTLVEAGHDATVVALRENSCPSVTEDEGVQVHRVAPGNIHWYISRIPGMDSLIVTAVREIEYSRAVWSVIRAIEKKHPFDLLEGTETGSVWTALWGRKLPLVIRLHGDPFTFCKYTPNLRMTPGLRLSRIIQRIALRRSRLLISPSQSHLQEISAELHGEHPPIEVVPNTVGSMNLEASAPLDRPGIRALLESSAPLVLYVGRIEKCKGVPTLLEAAARVHQVVPDCRFVLAGAPHATLRQGDLDDVINRLQLGEFVHFLGHVPHDNLAQLYSRAAVVVVPSHYETFGIAALESMKFGVPVVATAAGSLPEVVVNGVTGLLVPPGDAKAFADAITRLLVNKQEHREMTRRAKERSEEYQAAQQIPKTLELYEWAASSDLCGSPEAEHVFFSPHPDDAVLSCGGFMASLAGQHRSVRVVTVFASGPSGSSGSAFARHLQSKWGITAERKREDLCALRALGVTRLEQWGFADAPWRTDASGHPLYASYEELCEPVTPGDAATTDALRSFIEIFARDVPPSAILYFPLSLGGHVDHRHLFQISLWLRATGRRVRFYEDWPYAEMYTPTSAAGWFARTVPIDTEKKLEAIRQYQSQIAGLGGDSEELRKRVERFTHRRGVRAAVEGYWEISVSKAAQLASTPAAADPPFEHLVAHPRLKDFGNFIRTLSWRDLDSCLPVGRGICVDIGCGNGRHRTVVESKGYQWIGADRNALVATTCGLQATFEALPFASGRVATVVAWQVMEYLPNIETAVREAWRVLETGGVFCGSVSFLEPMHGRTYGGVSPLGLRSMLENTGFKDIQVLPGLCGFSLMAWTWLRRLLGPWAGRVALPFTAAILTPIMAIRFLVSWLSWRLGMGTGHGMRWVAQEAPLEFAGQLVFIARKSAQKARECISAS